MITRIHSATVIVADQDRALEFYVNTLGWEKRQDAQVGPGYRFLTVAPAGGDAELVLNPPHTSDRGPGGDTGVTLMVSDIDATYADLVAKGVNFTKPVETMPWGTKATWLQDPDGNTFFFIEG
jgi:catechol 2,3-dioxygenase-like lactoylglutathione lyase family enzyme